MECEVRLTGILNMYVLQEGEGTGGHGTEVAPRINAHLHQHLFSLRVNPMIDGIENSVAETDVLPMEEPTGSKENFLGNGFYVKKTYLGSTDEGVRKYGGCQYTRETISTLTDDGRRQRGRTAMGVCQREQAALCLQAADWVGAEASSFGP